MPPQTWTPSARIESLLSIYNMSRTGVSIPNGTIADPYLEYVFANPTQQNLLTRRKRWDRQEILSCMETKYKSRPHLSFIGDSVTRTAYNLLMRRLQVVGEGENVLVKGSDWDKQVHRVLLEMENGGNASFSFTFMAEFWKSEARLKVHSLDAGALVVNSGLWETKRLSTGYDDPEVLKVYATHLSQFAMNVQRLFPEEVTLVWRMTTPVYQDFLDGERKKFMTGFKVRAFNRLAEQILSAKDGFRGFQMLDPQDTFLATKDWKNTVQEDAYHPLEYITEILLDQMLDSVCGVGEMTWKDIQYLASLDD
ncbi:UNVERIFIED_CONTAM: hypothetical protein HDU68_011637 [Siphonaria sp. JEL0065]|nr:hypothetical protein HDU68_011637 [Siphonaria sp. JEL0065]